MSRQPSGAEIYAHSGKPCLDIVTLINLIASVISSNQHSSPDCQDIESRQILQFDSERKRLRLCTSAVLHKLFKSDDFLKEFDPNRGKGFIQNLSMPAYGNQCRVGGYLDRSNAATLPAAIEKLVSKIDETINSALPKGAELSLLLLEDPSQQLAQLAKKVGVTFKDQINTASLVPLAFNQTPAKSSSFAVGKVISAVETIEANDYFERMCYAVSQHLQYERDIDEDDLDTALESLEVERESADSQINRFLSFLDNEALSRVRLQITFQIMIAIADNASKATKIGHQLLAEYVNRVINLFEAIKLDFCSIDLTNYYGTAIEFDLVEYTSRVNFFFCLPVWSDWKTQITEQKGKGSIDKSYAVAREVSYRFRVNGKNPELNKSAFAARIDKIEKDLLNEETAKNNPGLFNRRLAELIFLAIVTPQTDEQPYTREVAIKKVNLLSNSLKINGRVAIEEIIAEVRGRINVMEKIASALIAVLRTKGESIFSQVHRASCQQFICVKRSIIEWSRLEGAESGVKDFLVRPQHRAREQVEWFKHVEISDSPDTGGLLFSVLVTTKITEHNLIVKGQTQRVNLKRLASKQVLQVCWVPYNSGKGSYQVVEAAKAARDWVLPASIHIEYEARFLNRNQKKADDKSKHYHAATVTAFLILVYCYLWCITRKLKQSTGVEADFTMLMLRLQQINKAATGDENEGNGEDYIYATAQSIEALLAQDINVHMQGVGLENLSPKNSALKYVKTGTFNAFSSAFPIAISVPKIDCIVPNIGLISYATRFCDDAPNVNSNEFGYLLTTQSYVASSIEQPFVGYELKISRMRSDIIDSPTGLSKQRLVQEEIAYLHSLGCQHIILLSHFYGDRHLNRSADCNSSLSSKEFLEEVSQTFPDLTIYIMLRDVFPATRLRSRLPNEAAFEILRAEDFTNFLNPEISTLRDLIPIYAFATLHAIEEQKRPQSGFNTYFLVSDRRISNINWTERPRQQLIDPEGHSTIRSCLITVLRGLHFIEAERGATTNGQLLPVLDPFSWISPTTIEAAGEVQVLHSRRQGKVLINYAAVLTNIASVLHRKK